MSYPEKNAVVLVSLDPNPYLDHCIAYNETTMTMQAFDGCKSAQDGKYAACSGSYYLRSLEDITLLTRPTSMLSLLNHVILKHPGSVLVCPQPTDSSPSCTVSLSVDTDLPFSTPKHAEPVVFVDGSVRNAARTTDSLTSFRFDAAPNSVLRYCYGM